MSRDLAFLLPELALMVTVALMLVAEMVHRAGLALLIGLVGLALSVWFTVPVLNAGTTVFGGTYRIDPLSGWAKLILLPATALSLLLVRAELAGRAREGSVYSLIVLVTIGALMLTGSGDVMLLVLGIVVTGLGSFALVAYSGDDAATEASMKYLVFGSVTGAVMIYGLSFWFAGSGSTSFSELGTLTGKPLIAAAGLIAVLVGLGYKAALVPFHFWVPDAYEGAPVSVAAYMSVVTKMAAIFALAQVLPDLPVETGWPLAIAAISVLTMTLGYLAALVQTNLVRLLAYSSVAQAGYFLLGLVALGKGAIALQSIIVFGAAYTAMNIGAFTVVLLGGRDMEAIHGLGRRAPFLGVAMVIFLLSLTGIPPLFGFFGKFLLFGAALKAGFLWLAIIAILNSVLSLAVYLRIIVAIYRAPEGDEAAPPRTSRVATLVWSVSLAATLAFGLFSQLIIG